jgi:hypothetical protein
MKNFVKQNWYKLMVGSSLLMASFGFMVYSISPAYSRNKIQIPLSENTTSLVGVNGVGIGDYVYFVDGGYIYQFTINDVPKYIYGSHLPFYTPKKVKLP